MRKRRTKNQIRIVVWLIVCLLLIMTAGYAAFSTSLSLNAKGNIIGTFTFRNLIDKEVTTGDGLYMDPVESGRYVYRGEAPENYIEFNGEMWRILAIEADGTAKVIRQGSIGLIPFDEPYVRSDSTYCPISSSGSYGQNIDSRYGCNACVSENGSFVNGSISGTLTKDASLNTYLNNTYYYSLTENAKNEIIAHKFNIGAIDVLSETGNDSLEKNIASEKMYTWVGKIGLANATDALKASTNKNCVSATDNMIDHKNTCNDSYFFTETHCWWWLINNHTREDTDTTSAAWIIYGNNIEGRVDGYSSRFADGGVKPTVFLKPDIKLSGSGTETDPYIIK